MKTDIFQSCGHCWVFQISWHIECSTFPASSFRIWKSSTGIPSPPLTLFIVMPPKAHLTLHSRMTSSSRVITPSWLSELWRSFLYSSSVHSCHLFLIFSASVRSIPFLSFIEPIFAWNLPLASLIFLTRSLVFSILLFSSISLHWSLRKAFLSLLAILWNSAFRWEYLSFPPLPFASLLFPAVCITLRLLYWQASSLPLVPPGELLLCLAFFKASEPQHKLQQQQAGLLQREGKETGRAASSLPASHHSSRLPLTSSPRPSPRPATILQAPLPLPNTAWTYDVLWGATQTRGTSIPGKSGYTGNTSHLLTGEITGTFRFVALHRYCMLLELDGLWQPCIEQGCRCHFSNSGCSLHASVPHFGNSHHISSIFILIRCVTGICDQWSLMLLLCASQVALVVKSPPANAGDVRDVGSIPGSER